MASLQFKLLGLARA